MRPLRVLVTASGAPGTAALVRALRENGEREIAVVGCDMSEHAVGRRLCDAFQQVPPGSSPLFAPAVLELCRRARVDAVLPQSSHELLALAEAKGSFAQAGVAVLVSPPEAVRTADDKAACYALLGTLGVRVPAWHRVRGGRELARAAAALGYQHRAVCLKPVRGSGSRGFHVLDPSLGPREELLRTRPGDRAMRLEEVVELLPEVGGEELLVMELVEGEERSVDGIAAAGRLLLAQAKTREAMRAGLAMLFRALVDEELIEVVRRIVAGLGLDHFFDVQVKGDAVIEVNPRISTLVYQEDVNLPYLGLCHALGELDADEVAAHARLLRPTRKALRFFDQLEWDE